MRVAVLGSGGSQGIPVPFCDCCVCSSGDRRLRTSYLVKAGDKNLLVELSPDFREQQLRHGFPLEYMFISHPHDDHMRGLIELRHILLIAKVKIPKIKILISSKLHDRFLTEETGLIRREGVRWAYKSLLKNKKLENHILKYYKKYHFKDFSILLFKNKHANTFSDGFLLEEENTKLMYLGDASHIGKKTKELIEHNKIDLLVANTPYFYTHPAFEKKNDHMGIETLRKLKVRKVLISHLSHRAGLTHKEILRKLAAHPKFLLAYDGMELRV